MARRIRDHIRSNIYGLVAIFLALSGTAAASHLAVRSNDIINGQVKSPDVGTNQIRSADVRDGHLTGGGLSGVDILDGSLTGTDISDVSLSGADINEGTLDKVQSARVADQGGTGRFVSGGWPPCDPETTTYIACETLGPFNLNAPGRVLVAAAVTAKTEWDSEEFSGACKLNINGVSYDNTAAAFHGHGEYAADNATLITVTGILSGGNNYITLECYQGPDGAIEFAYPRIVAVSLSGN